MADVDFSHAVLDVIGDNKPMGSTYYQYMNLGASGIFFDPTETDRVNTNNSVSQIVNTPTKTSFLYTGEFTASGTSFHMQYQYYSYYYMWKVSNISFNSGDTYSFIIDVEISGN